MVTIVDYGLGNTASVMRAFKKLQYDVILTDDSELILKASKIVLPGVGHFEHGMEQLYRRNLVEHLNEAVLVRKIPVLGICLGMQLMTKESEEGNVDGLGWIEAHTRKIDTELKVPHVGWNSLNIQVNDPIFQSIPSDKLFYFVHSYCVHCDNKENIMATTGYGQTFVSVLRKENIIGVQFHPEKSHQQGFRLISNFMNN